MKTPLHTSRLYPHDAGMEGWEYSLRVFADDDGFVVEQVDHYEGESIQCVPVRHYPTLQEAVEYADCPYIG